MIKLFVEEWCKGGCPEFEADVDKLAVFGDPYDGCAPPLFETTIKCKHESRCRNLVNNYLSLYCSKERVGEK